MYALDMETRLGEIVLSARTRMGLTQEDFGSLVGVSHSYIYNLEKGKNRIPSPDVMTRLARVIGTSKAELLRAVGYLDEDDLVGGRPATLREALGNDDEFADVVERMAGDPGLRAAMLRLVGAIGPGDEHQS